VTQVLSSPLTGAIPQETLWRMCYNALLYSHKDTSAQGHTLWTRGGDKLRVTAFDDYFALTDQVTRLDHDHARHFLMPIEELKTLEKDLRDKTGPFDLGAMPFAPDDGVISAELHDADALCFPEGYLIPTPVKFFALSPDRLRRLSLLKPAGYPIDCQVFVDVCTPDADKIIAFRYGPSVRGAMAPVNRDDLEKLYKGEEIWK
jgi:hypothetical protein